MLDRVAALPRGVMVVAVVMALGTAVMAVLGLVAWMLLSPRRRVPTRA